VDSASNESTVQTVTYTKEVVNNVVFDDFNRVDNATTLGTTNTGQVWENYLNVAGISGNKAYTSGGSNNSENIVDAGVANGAIEVDLVYSTYVAVIARYVDTNNCVVARISSTGIGLFKFIDGANTKLGEYLFTPISGQNYKVKAVLNGSDITVYLDDVLRITASDSYNSTITKHGFRLSPTGGVARADNFKITN
jgi:hypothetical protein